MRPSFNIHDKSLIYIGKAKSLLQRHLPEGRTIVITDTTVDALYGDLTAGLERIVIEGLEDEKHKSIATLEMIYSRLVELRADRSTFILGVGGGIVTDIAGFVASTYMRGVDFGFISTTLMGQVDASIGGKNGVNFGGNKNMVGTFNQPRFIIIDPELLTSLSERQFRAGLAEAVKCGIIADVQLFELLEQSTFEMLRCDAQLRETIIRCSIAVKVRIVEQDPNEGDLRRLLNLGHTMAHAIESCYTDINHGEAVAMGIAIITEVSHRLDLLSEANYHRIVALLEHLGFNLHLDLDIERILRELTKDKKCIEGAIHIVLPTAIGSCTIKAINPPLLRVMLTPEVRME